MAADVKLTFAATTSEMEKDLLKSIRRINSAAVINFKTGRQQPLGRITGDVKEFTKSIEAANARVIAFGASAGIFYQVGNAISFLIKSTIDVEKRLADINVVANLTDKSLSKFSDSLFDIAKNTAQSFDSVATAATELSRQGLGVQETLKRTNAALILTRLSGLDAADSVKTLTATLNSFYESALDATDVVNKFAAVDAAFAVSSKDLADAISRVGSSANEAGLSLEQLIGLVTSAQQTTARGGAVIGNSFKTIFTRLNRQKTIDLVESLGIKSTTTSGELKSTIQLLGELASVYDNLGQIQKNSVAEQVGGVFQINVLKATLKDLGREFSIYGRAVDIANNATDEAVKRNERLNETLSAQANSVLLSLTQAASKIGSLTFAPGAKGGLGIAQNILDEFNNIDAKSVGGKIAEGIFKGIGNFLSGPGAVALTGIVGALLIRLGKFSSDTFRELLGVNKSSQEQANIQKGISNILATNRDLVYQYVSGQKTSVQVQAEALNILRAQAAELAIIDRLSTSIAAKNASLPKGVRVSTKPSFASGYIGGSERDMIKSGAYGTPKSAQARPGYVRGLGKITYNTSEDIVRDFPTRGKDSVIPKDKRRAQETFKRFGYASGFIPNIKDLISSMFGGKYQPFKIKAGGKVLDLNKMKSRGELGDFRKVTGKGLEETLQLQKLKNSSAPGSVFDAALGDFVPISKAFSLPNKPGKSLSRVRDIQKEGSNRIARENIALASGGSLTSGGASIASVGSNKSAFNTLSFFSGQSRGGGIGLNSDSLANSIAAGFNSPSGLNAALVNKKLKTGKNSIRLVNDNGQVAEIRKIGGKYSFKIQKSKNRLSTDNLGEIITQARAGGFRAAGKAGASIGLSSGYIPNFAAGDLEEALAQATAYFGNKSVKFEEYDAFLTQRGLLDPNKYKSKTNLDELIQGAHQHFGKKQVGFAEYEKYLDGIGAFESDPHIKRANQLFDFSGIRSQVGNRYLSPKDFNSLLSSNPSSQSTKAAEILKDYNYSSVNVGKDSKGILGSGATSRRSLLSTIQQGGYSTKNINLEDGLSGAFGKKVFGNKRFQALLGRAGVSSISTKGSALDNVSAFGGKKTLSIPKDADLHNTLEILLRRKILNDRTGKLNATGFDELEISGKQLDSVRKYVKKSGFTPNFVDFPHIGEGAFADVYKVNPFLVAKILKTNHLNFKGRFAFNATKRGLDGLTSIQNSPKGHKIFSDYKVGNGGIIHPEQFGKNLYGKDLNKDIEDKFGTKEYYLQKFQQKDKKITQITDDEAKLFQKEINEILRKNPGIAGIKKIDDLRGDNFVNRNIIDAFGVASGYVPNYAGIKDAISREQAAGVARNKIKVGFDPRIGFGVYNTKDEPRGLSQGVNREIKRGNNPKKSGIVPNFAEGDVGEGIAVAGGITGAVTTLALIAQGFKNAGESTKDAIAALDNELNDLNESFKKQVSLVGSQQNEFRKSIQGYKSANKEFVDARQSLSTINKNISSLESNLGVVGKTAAGDRSTPGGRLPSSYEIRQANLEKERLMAEIENQQKSRGGAQEKLDNAQKQRDFARLRVNADSQKLRQSRGEANSISDTLVERNSNIESQKKATRRAIRNQKISNAGFGLAIAGEIGGGLLSQGFSSVAGGGKNSRVAGSVGSGLGDVAGFAGAGASVAGAPGAAIGALIGTVKGTVSVFKEINSVSPEYITELKKLIEQSQKQQDAGSQILGDLELLKEVGAGSKEYNAIQARLANSLSQFDDITQQTIVSAISNGTAQEALAKASEELAKKVGGKDFQANFAQKSENGEKIQGSDFASLFSGDFTGKSKTNLESLSRKAQDLGTKSLIDKKGLSGEDFNALSEIVGAEDLSKLQEALKGSKNTKLDLTNFLQALEKRINDEIVGLDAAKKANEKKYTLQLQVNELSQRNVEALNAYNKTLQNTIFALDIDKIKGDAKSQLTSGYNNIKSGFLESAGSSRGARNLTNKDELDSINSSFRQQEKDVVGNALINNPLIEAIQGKLSQAGEKIAAGNTDEALLAQQARLIKALEEIRGNIAGGKLNPSANQSTLLSLNRPFQEGVGPGINGIGKTIFDKTESADLLTKNNAQLDDVKKELVKITALERVQTTLAKQKQLGAEIGRLQQIGQNFGGGVGTVTNPDSFQDFIKGLIEQSNKFIDNKNILDRPGNNNKGFFQEGQGVAGFNLTQMLQEFAGGQNFLKAGSPLTETINKGLTVQKSREFEQVSKILQDLERKTGNKEFSPLLDQIGRTPEQNKAAAARVVEVQSAQKLGIEQTNDRLFKAISEQAGKSLGLDKNALDNGLKDIVVDDPGSALIVKQLQDTTAAIVGALTNKPVNTSVGPASTPPLSYQSSSTNPMSGQQIALNKIENGYDKPITNDQAIADFEASLRNVTKDLTAISLGFAPYINASSTPYITESFKKDAQVLPRDINISINSQIDSAAKDGYTKEEIEAILNRIRQELEKMTGKTPGPFTSPKTTPPAK